MTLVVPALLPKILAERWIHGGPTHNSKERGGGVAICGMLLLLQTALLPLWSHAAASRLGAFSPFLTLHIPSVIVFSQL